MISSICLLTASLKDEYLAPRVPLQRHIHIRKGAKAAADYDVVELAVVEDGLPSVVIDEVVLRRRVRRGRRLRARLRVAKAVGGRLGGDLGGVVQERRVPRVATTPFGAAPRRVGAGAARGGDDASCVGVVVVASSIVQ